MAALLPYLAGAQVEGVEFTDDLLCIAMRTIERPVCYPGCGVTSAREHSRYTRVVADRAVGGRIGARTGRRGELLGGVVLIAVAVAVAVGVL